MTKIFIDAYADCSEAEATKADILIAPSKLKIGKKTYLKNDEIKLSESEVIKKIKAGECQVVPLTIEEWVDFFTPYLQQGDDVVFFTISQLLLADGGEDLRSAFCILSDNFPERKCVLVDTLTVSRGTSEIAMMSSILHRTEPDLDKVLEFAHTLIGRYITVLAIDDVESLKNTLIFKKVSKNFVGATVNLKPIISINPDGNIQIVEKVRGFKSATNRIYSIVAQNGENIADYTFSIVNFGAKDEADKLFEKFATQVESNEIRNLPISAYNAVNVGGKVVGITFHAKKYDR